MNLEFGIFKAAIVSKNGFLRGVNDVDILDIDSLVIDDFKKSIILNNTSNFIAGKKSQHVLLWGAKGCGKSSLAKAVFARFYNEGLRVIQISKDRLEFIEDIIYDFRNSNFKFIIFCDDLSFDKHDDSYKFLKPILEGSIETPPSNMLFYATSNYRHLIDQYAQVGLNEDIYSMHRIDEKLSLYERFGISIGFYAMNQDEYLKIIFNNLDYFDISNLNKNEIIREALAYATERGGRSGRVAKQFVEIFSQNYN